MKDTVQPMRVIVCAVGAGLSGLGAVLNLGVIAKCLGSPDIAPLDFGLYGSYWLGLIICVMGLFYFIDRLLSLVDEL